MQSITVCRRPLTTCTRSPEGASSLQTLWKSMNYPGASPQVRVAATNLFEVLHAPRTCLALAHPRKWRERGIQLVVPSSTYNPKSSFVLPVVLPDTTCCTRFPDALRNLQLPSRFRVRLLMPHKIHPTRTLLPTASS